MVYDRFLGVLLTIVGLFILVAALGEFILRIFFAFFALWLIDYGLRIQGKSSLIIQISRFRNSFWY